MPHESHNTILCVLTSMVHVALRQITGAYAGFLRGGGPTLKFLGFWIYMPRTAKLRAFVRRVWGHAPQEN